MTHVNPHYSPDWETVHDRHALERDRAAAERDRLIAEGATGTDEYRRASAEFERHQQACLARFRTRHATVQEYAAWLFDSFSVDGGDWEGGIPVPVIDFAELRTIEAADAAWSRVQRIVSESAAERRLSLPVGQPEGLRAFAAPASPTLNRYWREFSPSALYPTGRTGAGTSTLVTTDEQADGWHVCFMHDWASVGVSVTNAIERLATAIYREACALAEQQAAASSGIRGWLERRRTARARAAMLAPDRFHFYQHIPPRGETGLQEQFDRVALEFRDGRYRAPEWAASGIIPALVQSARFDCALDTAAPGGVRPQLALTHDR